MKPTCEIMVQRVLPAIRAGLARTMMIDHGCTQQQVADILGLSRAAVSQYVSEKRGAEVGFSEETNEEIRKFATNLVNGMPAKAMNEGMCNVCKFVQRSGWLFKNAPEAEYCILCKDDED
ncbi:transcriptional regulator [Methanococcoides alaskense]|uniref:Transcriptional regulator n=1 Tax=Methanococcoides alaskense TaxID=325778 RepID=A0AA90ZC75_9EURY|nr:transcriptional regulator [Methanococcoides alaskense]MDA0524009.1 transcriptional regulator [Methanococcoides alaskense]MDR6222458.1 putative transcriptional regulator [Methanococcoides alaskense]